VYSKYYQSELTYLREVGRAFAEANPAMAGMLAERGGDPDVERLLEGFAFLTAQIRQRVDDAAPEIAVPLCELLLPQYARPLPACTVVEFTAPPGVLRGRHVVPTGSELGASADGTVCRFRTTTDVEVLPLSIVEVELDRSSANTPILHVVFQTTAEGRPEVLQRGGVRLFVSSEPGVGMLLALWVARYLKKLVVRGVGGKQEFPLPLSAVHLPGFDAKNALLPWPPFGTAGFRAVQEYFTCPHKFLFIDVRNLDRAAALEQDRFEIVFEFDRPPEIAARLGRESLRLHCAPAINLFEAPADPFTRGVFGEERLLTPAEVNARHAEIFEVRSVTGLPAKGRGQARRYLPFHDFSHAATGDDAGYYRLTRTRSLFDDGVETHLSIVTPRDVPPSLDEETLSIELLCTNRQLPAQLRVGDVSTVTPSSPTGVKFRNITEVTRPVSAFVGSELMWRLISHLGINRRSLLDASVLKAALELYNFQAAADQLAGRANRLRVAAIRSVEGRPTKALIGGMPVRGSAVTIEVDEKGFVSEGDAFLFGATLVECLAAQVNINSFVQLALRLHPSQSEYKWPPRNGDRPLL
jgi:type VI secretion system protein ImpG